jgi:hypothetical protein
MKKLLFKCKAFKNYKQSDQEKRKETIHINQLAAVCGANTYSFLWILQKLRNEIEFQH